VTCSYSSVPVTVKLVLTPRKTHCYPDRFHPDADVLPVKQHIHETGSLTCTVLENVDHTWTLWTPANENAKIAAVKRMNKDVHVK